MKLTLRTLLAWLDDTLPAAEVREIGQLVNETPFAKELVERIHRVTRRRRLTVPGSSGPDATDPALVASYLDNELPPDQVAEYEKRCLTSEVHLAEVASAHQILSLIGQKAKVPAAARHRMYRLVKGREAVGVNVPRAFAAAAPEPVAARVKPWEPVELPSRSALERFGPVVAVVALIALLMATATMLLRPEGHDAGERGYALTIPGAEPGAPTVPVATPKVLPVAPPPRAAVNPPEATTAETNEPVNPPAEPPAEPTKKAAGAGATVPAGSAGLVAQADGPLLRARPEGSPPSWERLETGSALRAGDVLVNLDPFRTVLRLGEARLELVRDAEIRIRAGGTPAFDLLHGRAVIRAPEPAGPVEVGFGGAVVAINAPAGGTVGLERVASRAPGEPEPVQVSLHLIAPSGKVSVRAGEGVSETVEGPGALVFTPPGRFSPRSAEAPPAWVVEAGPSARDQELGKQFAAFFKGDLPPAASLFTAQVDESKPLRRLAVQGLAAIGQWPEVVAALDAKGDPIARRAALGALREGLSVGSGVAKEIQAHLSEIFGAEPGAAAYRLLIGFGPADARKASTYEQLIGELKDSAVAIRELALDNLQALTGRDSLGYDPDQPEGAGLRAWQDLLDRNELPPRGEG